MSPARIRRPAGVLLAALLAVPAAASEDDWLKPLGPPPRAQPKRMSGGESFPPLPLPVTPLRRSERKREPAPPKLAGKVVWGERASFTFPDGGSTEVADWNQCPGDLQALMKKATGSLGVRYGHETINLAEFHFDPELLPVLFLSGSRSIRLAEEHVRRLRGYVLAGGMVVFDSIAGSPYFHAASVELAGRMFPERRVRPVPLDHPLFRMFHDATTVRYPRNLDRTTPRFEAVYVGSRIGVLISPYGMGVGWDGREVPFIDRAIYYDVDSASRLGINIVAYAIGWAEAGRRESRPEPLAAQDEAQATDELVFAQLRHGGAWNVHPGAAAGLLARIRRDLALDVHLARVPVDPAGDDLAPYPVLYLTGLDDFAWSDAELAALRAFLERSGTLVINNGLGLATFDAAVRRELSRLLPDATLERVGADHPLFTLVHDVRSVRYAPAVLARDGQIAEPHLEAIAIGGDLRVIYSPYDLEAGWNGCAYPQAYTLEPADALRLGQNLLVYVATH